MNTDNLNVPPIKPNQLAAANASGGPVRPKGKPNPQRNFNSFLESGLDDVVGENVFDANADASTSVFNLPSTGKPNLTPPHKKHTRFVANQNAPAPLPEKPVTNQAPIAHLNKPQKSSQVVFKQAQPNDAKENVDEEDDDLLVNEFPNEIGTEGEEALAKAKSHPYDEDPAKAQIAMGKRFEVPTRPLSPSDDDMIAQAEVAPDPAIALRQLKEAQLKKANLPSKPSRLSTDSDSSQIASTASLQMKDKTKHELIHADDRLAFQTGHQPAIAPISPILAQTQSATTQSNATQQQALTELIDKIVKSIQIIKQSGVTETVVTLRGPILDGAKLTLTGFDSAPKEFNISFSDLSAPAKDFLDRKLTKDSLADTLQSEGYTIHIITTTTLAESSLHPDQQQFNRDQEQQQQQQQQQQNRPQYEPQDDDEDV